MSAVSIDHPDELRALRDLATEAAHAAGELIVSMRSSGQISSETKSSAVDLVTNADRDAERLIITHLLAARPDDSVLGEEGGASVHGSSGITWIIDPIDGTTNFVYGHTATCVSIAATVLDDEVPEFFSSFDRVFEIVGPDDIDKQKARLRFAFYRDRGYPITRHDLQHVDAR